MDAVNTAGVAAIRVSSFYAADAPTTIIRLCFAKRDASLDMAATRLADLLPTA